MVERLVLDVSAALSWAFRDEATDASRDLLARAGALHFLVPGLWHVELGNALLQAEKRRRLTVAGTTEFLELMQTLIVETDLEAFESASPRLMDLARRHRLTTYDATYLDVALRHGAALATRDEELRRAAVAEHVVAVPV